MLANSGTGSLRLFCFFFQFYIAQLESSLYHLLMGDSVAVKFDR